MKKDNDETEVPASSEDISYEVGYGKPPVATRFPKGKSGNPKGRPKGSRGFDALLAKTFAKKVAVREGGRTRTVTTGEAIMLSLREGALKREPFAMKKMLELMTMLGTSPAGKFAELPNKLSFTLNVGDKIINENIVDDPQLIEDFYKRIAENGGREGFKTKVS